jgi:hypothetical protein
MTALRTRLCVMAFLFASAISNSWAALPGQPHLPSRPAEQMPFPEIKDWNSLSISLVRTPCFGRCPSYTVEIKGNGTVIYTGNASVAVTGKQQRTISQASVHRLFEKFRAADYFWSLDNYSARVSDLSTAQTRIEFDGRQKQVIDYGGRMVGMPKELADLESAIDEAAGTERWIKPQSR